MPPQGYRPNAVDDDALVVLTGLAAGGTAFALGCRPTGSVPVDVVLTTGAVAAAIWAAAAARWWQLAVATVVATVLAGPVWASAVGAAGLVAAIVHRRAPHRTIAAVAAAGSVVALATVGDLWRFGFSALVAVVTIGAVATVGIVGRGPGVTGAALRIAAVVAAIAAVGVLGLGAAAASARDDLRAGNAAATRGLEHIRSARFDEARFEFANAAVLFRRADSSMRRPWAQISRLVPIAAQHRAAASDLSFQAATVSRLLDAELEAVDLDAVRIVDGRIDIDAVRALQDPMDRVNGAIARLDAVVDERRSDWLVGPVRDRVDELAVDLDRHGRLGENAAHALRVAPAILGEDEPRVYLVMFTTPAEARGQGGFMGNFAEITVDEGRISMTELGRHGELSASGVRPRRLDHAPADWIDRYGPFGFTTGPDGAVGETPWANITMSPHFPSTAQVAAELYPQSGGRRIDGVLSLDVHALESIVRLVGPIDVPRAGAPLTGTTTASFLLVDQYRIPEISERADLLEDVARVTFDRLLGPSSPDPIALGRALRPRVRERRVMAWAADPDEQGLLTAIGMDGSLLGGTEHGVAVSVVNAGGNKIDSFLSREFALRPCLGPDRERRVAVELSFTNRPQLELPDYVVGNLVGLPRGWSRSFVTVHTSLDLVEASDGDGALGLQRTSEAGLAAYASFLDIAPGGTATWRLVFDVPARVGRVTLQPQPLVTPERWTLDVGPHSMRAITTLTDVEFASDAWQAAPGCQNRTS